MCAVDPEADHLFGARGEGQAFGIIGIESDDFGGGEEIPEQHPQLFHRLVIKADIKQHRYRRSIKRD